jgi:hypothetical protein
MSQRLVPIVCLLVNSVATSLASSVIYLVKVCSYHSKTFRNLMALLKNKASHSVIHSEGKKIIYNVTQFFDKEKKKGVTICLQKVIERAEKAVGKV